MSANGNRQVTASRDHSAAQGAVTVAIQKRSVDTFGRDMEDMLRRKLTFAEAIDTPEFSIMARQRLKTVRADLFEQLDQVGIA